MKIELDPLNQDELSQAKLMLKAGKYYSTLDDIYQLCRGYLKHNDTTNIEIANTLIEEIKSMAYVLDDE